MPKLIFSHEPFAGRVYALTLEKTAVGRGDQNTLALHDPSVSLAHCEILVHGPEVIVHDLGSANGTFVAGVRVRGQAPINHGQIVRFGSVTARLELDSAVPDDSTAGMDTIHLAGRIMADQRREERKPKVDPAMKLDPGAGAESIEHTVMLPRMAPSAPIAAPSAPNPAPKQIPVKRVMVIGAALALGLAFLFWMIWGRK